MTIVLRTAGDPALLSAPLRQAVAAIDRAVPVADLGTLDAIVADSIEQPRFFALLAGAFAALALILAAIGLYGVTSYGVNERRREIGIRLTLGAGRAAAERFVLGRVARLVGIGVALGLAASVALSPVVRTLLYELEPRDPATIAIAAVVLTIVGLLAGWLPARRAARIDPAQVLREG